MNKTNKQITNTKPKIMKWFFLFFIPVIYLIPLSAWAETTGSVLAGVLFWIAVIPSIGWFLFCMMMVVVNWFRIFVLKK